jgi:TetR/AcrR family transcriptional regulator, cholesterol catabolism regulator
VVHFSNRGSKPSVENARARRRADRRRVEILQAASQVFRTKGFTAAGMREIAVAADLSPGNLYHYFAGKDEILFFCQTRTLDRLLAAAAEARRARGPAASRLRELAVAHVLCLIDQAEGSAAHFDVDALPPRLRSAIVVKRDRYERAVRALVAAGMRAGHLARTDPAVVTRAFLGALNWTVQWFRHEGPEPPEAVAAMVAEYAVAGLEKQRGKHSDRSDRQRRTSGRRVRSLQDAARGAA